MNTGLSPISKTALYFLSVTKHARPLLCKSFAPVVVISKTHKWEEQTENKPENARSDGGILTSL